MTLYPVVSLLLPLPPPPSPSPPPLLSSLQLSKKLKLSSTSSLFKKPDEILCQDKSAVVQLVSGSETVQVTVM